MMGGKRKVREILFVRKKERGRERQRGAERGRERQRESLGWVRTAGAY